MVATPAIETAVAASGGTGLLEPMAPEAMSQELEKIDDNLKKIYVDADDPPLIQAQLAKYSFRSIAKFQTFAFSSDKVTEICKSSGLGEQTQPNMGIISSIILAWQTCKAKTEATTRRDADKKNLGIDSVLKPGEYTTIKKQYENAHGVKSISDLPGASTIKKLDREIEDGEFTAWRLEELVSKKEVDEAIKAKNDDQGIPATVTMSGMMIRQQVRVKVGLPKDPEGFRKRIAILNAGIELSKLKNPNHEL